MENLSTALITVLSGVGVFILSQFFLEFWLRPRVKVREKCGNLSRLMLKFHSEYLNAMLTSEQMRELDDASADLLSTAWGFYRNKKKRMKYLEISREINLIIWQSLQARERKNYEAILKARDKIAKLERNILVTFERT